MTGGCDRAVPVWMGPLLCLMAPSKGGGTTSPPELSVSHLEVMEQAQGGGGVKQGGEKKSHVVKKAFLSEC